MIDAVVVYGPTASCKTGLSDEVAARLSGVGSTWVPTLVVDSMQVYRELPIITNQRRDRPAELVGITSVTDEWSMARHRFAADAVIDGYEGPIVLDAGTGMYLNGILLDIDLAPIVPHEIRKRAEASSHGATNPRRSARAKELELAGAPTRGSIWSAPLRYNVTMIYLRPGRETFDCSINIRSRKIVRDGLQEAEELRTLSEEGFSPNPSVMSSIGVRELTNVLAGTLSLEEAESQVASRTRRLARRQIRWFDKLSVTLANDAGVIVISNLEEIPPLNSMFDILGS